MEENIRHLDKWNVYSNPEKASAQGGAERYRVAGLTMLRNWLVTRRQQHHPVGGTEDGGNDAVYCKTMLRIGT